VLAQTEPTLSRGPGGADGSGRVHRCESLRRTVSAVVVDEWEEFARRRGGPLLDGGQDAGDSRTGLRIPAPAQIAPTNRGKGAPPRCDRDAPTRFWTGRVESLAQQQTVPTRTRTHLRAGQGFQHRFRRSTPADILGYGTTPPVWVPRRSQGTRRRCRSLQRGGGITQWEEGPQRKRERAGSEFPAVSFLGHSLPNTRSHTQQPRTCGPGTPEGVRVRRRCRTVAWSASDQNGHREKSRASYIWRASKTAVSVPPLRRKAAGGNGKNTYRGRTGSEALGLRKERSCHVH